MGINFPSSPTLNQLYPQPVQAGVPLYRWDGEKWVIDNSAASVSSYVRYDQAQALSEPQKVQARANVYAAPFDAAAYFGIQVNGNFDVCVEKPVNSSTAGTLGDVWRSTYGGAVVVGGGVYAYPVVPGIAFWAVMQPTTPVASLAASDFGGIYQSIEGFRIARLGWGGANPQPITVAFWSSHHRPGLYTVAIRNGANNRSCAASYTHVSADTAQYNVVTFPGDTGGTWQGDNSIGMSLMFSAGCGSTYIAPSAGTWLNGNYIAGPGQINGVAAGTDTFRIGGVMVLPGLDAPSAARAPLIVRPYDQELLLCQRYLWCSNPSTPKGISVGTLMGYGGLSTQGIALCSINFGVAMRTTQPTLSVWNNGVANQLRNTSTGGLVTVNAPSGAYFSQRGGTLIYCTSHTIGANWVDFDLIADARL